jgi:hypothetical protein
MMRFLWIPAMLAVLAACGEPRGEAVPLEQPSGIAMAGPVTTAPAAEELAAADEAFELPVMHIYKTPTCGCCADWVTHVEQAGFPTEVHDLATTVHVRAGYGVPIQFASCHTAVVGDYAIEGHVPADLIVRLLRERPDVRGLAVPGMPMGSPGMEGPYKEAYDVIAFGSRGAYVFARR